MLYRWQVLVLSISINFMAMLDTGMVNIAVPAMMAADRSSAQEGQWILTSCLLAMGLMQPFSGWGCRRFGRKKMYMLSVVLFTGGAGICSLAHSNAVLLAGRFMQGCGSGLIYPVAMLTLYHTFPREERARAMSLWGMAAMAAPALAPALGGYILQHWSWQALFTLQLPLGGLNLLLAFLLLKADAGDNTAAFDRIGAGLIGAGLGGLLLAVNKSAAAGWALWQVSLLVTAALFCLAVFACRAWGQTQPLLEVGLLLRTNLRLSLLVLACGTTGLYGGLFLLPLFLQKTLHYTVLDSGLMMLPAALAAAAVMPAAVWLARRYGSKTVVIAGCLLLGASFGLFALFPPAVSSLAVAAAMALRGAGLGLFLVTATSLGIHSLPADKINAATVFKSITRQLAGAFGIAAAAAVLDMKLHFYGAAGFSWAAAYNLAQQDTFWGLASLCWCGILPACQLETVRQKRPQAAGSGPEA